MRFKLHLQVSGKNRLLTLNYQYPLSAAIYRIIQRADEAYAVFLHDQGYRATNSLKAFKLFTFSDINTKFRIEGDGMRLMTDEASLMVCFHLPEAAENFIRGLFMQQQMEIADKKYRVVLNITQVEALPSGLTGDAFQEIIVQPLSVIIAGKKNAAGNYDYLQPSNPDFIPQLMYNWREKYKALNIEVPIEEAFDGAGMEVLFYNNPPRSRLLTIKAGEPAETKIKGFYNFRLKVMGKKEILELLMNTGVGISNSIGVGYISML